MKKLSKRFLNSIDACKEGVERWEEKGSNPDLIATLKQLMQEDKRDWANWLMARCMVKKQRIAYAAFAAQQVLHIFEKEYPEDKRPRQAIESAIKVMKNNTAKNRSAAGFAAESAAESARSAAEYAESAESAAGYAAEYAGYAEYAARYAAWSAEYAARSAEYAARSAEYAAGSARYAMMKKILRHGIKILEGENNDD